MFSWAKIRKHLVMISKDRTGIKCYFLQTYNIEIVLEKEI